MHDWPAISGRESRDVGWGLEQPENRDQIHKITALKYKAGELNFKPLKGAMVNTESIFTAVKPDQVQWGILGEKQVF